MLDREKALYYYKSLLFNHFESGGTCEQRVLVLRARFDRILEELSDNNEESKNFYVEKLQQIFKSNSQTFTKKIQEECHSLRRYLNGVQHSTFEADEQQYILSVKRLTQIIYLTSNIKIPSELVSIWTDNKVSNDTKKCIDTVSHVISKKKFPVAICIDIQNISGNNSRRNKLNSVILSFIKEISDKDLPIDLTLYFIEKSRIKVISPFKNNVSFINVENNFNKAVNKLINKISHSLIECETTESAIDSSQVYEPWLITLFDQKTVDCLVPNDNFITQIGSKSIKMIPVGLTSGMRLDNYKKICREREAVILQEGKESDFFSWLINCFTIICSVK